MLPINCNLDEQLKSILCLSLSFNVLHFRTKIRGINKTLNQTITQHTLRALYIVSVFLFLLIFIFVLLIFYFFVFCTSIYIHLLQHWGFIVVFKNIALPTHRPTIFKMQDLFSYKMDVFMESLYENVCAENSKSISREEKW